MTEPTLEEQAFAALQEQEAEITGSLARILDALDIDGDEDGWEDDAVQLIERLRDVDDAAREIDKAIGQWAGVALSPAVAKAYVALSNALDGMARDGK